MPAKISAYRNTATREVSRTYFDYETATFLVRFYGSDGAHVPERDLSASTRTEAVQFAQTILGEAVEPFNPGV